MAMNPLYRNEFYFFSNMYDDSLITDFYHKISRESYERSIDYQQNMLGRKRYRLNSEIFYKSSIKEFKVDHKYNLSVGLPAGSRTMHFNTLILPVFNKKKFLTTYGLDHQKVPLVDFFKRTDIFDKTITLQIGKYRIMSACLVCNDNKNTTLAIPNSSEDGITNANFSKILEEYDENEPVWIFSDEITQAYYIDTTTTASVSASVDEKYKEYYDVKVPIDAKVNQIGRSRIHTPFNSWDCLISLNSSVYGRKILVASPCTLRTTDATDNYFSVPKKFIDMIKSSGINFSAWFINRPNKKHILLYPYNSDTIPILNLDYVYNPSGNINVEVFEIDSNTMCKGRKLYDPEFTQVYFPNIFDFSKLNVNNSDLLIEVTEYAPSYTNQIMTNSIQPLIKSLGPELYTEFVVNDHDKSLDGVSMDLKNYHPTYYPIDSDDFITSEYKDDFRGYILDKINKTIESDPYLAASYYQWMIAKNNKVTTLSGTPKALRFGTKKSGEFSGINEVVLDTSIASIMSDDIQHFTEEHSYITYYSSNTKCAACVYVNGKYIRPTCTRFFKGLNYLFFPIRVINEEMERFSSDAELLAASPITVDIYPNTFCTMSEVPKDRVVIDSVDPIKLFTNIESPNYSLDEVVVYNTSTGEYLGSLLDLFNIHLSISEYQINNSEASDKVLISNGNAAEYLLTILGELYNTMDNEPIILSGNEIEIGLNDFIDEMIANGIITDEEKDAFTHKKINFNDLKFIPKNYGLVGIDISVYVKNFKHEWIINPSIGIYDAETDTTKYEIKSGTNDSDLSRFIVFKNGLLDISAKLSKVDNSYCGVLELTLEGDQTNATGEILIVHMPIKYHTDSFNFQNRVFYMKDANQYETETNLIWPIGNNDGIIMESHSDRLYNSFSFENDYNIKFTSDGYRLPPNSASTYSLYRQYYDADRAAAYNLSGDSSDGTVMFIDMGIPIIDIAKQNPYSNKFDTSYVKNPLDVLTHISE